jgi:MFS family permease
MSRSGIIPLLPIMGAVFVAYLIIGIPMPILPLHVHQRLGLSAVMVGIVAGAPSAGALLVRTWAGYFADRNGSKRAVMTGLLIAVFAGSFYLFSLRFVERPTTSVAVLIMGRLLLGVGESFIITGALSWGLVLMGSASHSSRAELVSGIFLTVSVRRGSR